MPEFMVRLAKKSGPLSEDGGDDDLSLHNAIAKSLKPLEALAKQLGVPPLSAFVSEDPENVYDLVDDEDEAEELMEKLPPVKWSSPTEALPTVQALHEHFVAKKPCDGVKNAAKLIPELANLETVLNYANKKKANFRFYREF